MSKGTIAIFAIIVAIALYILYRTQTDPVPLTTVVHDEAVKVVITFDGFDDHGEGTAKVHVDAHRYKRQIEMSIGTILYPFDSKAQRLVTVEPLKVVAGTEVVAHVKVCCLDEFAMEPKAGSLLELISPEGFSQQLDDIDPLINHLRPLNVPSKTRQVLIWGCGIHLCSMSKQEAIQKIKEGLVDKLTEQLRQDLKARLMEKGLPASEMDLVIEEAISNQPVEHIAEVKSERQINDFLSARDLMIDSGLARASDPIFAVSSH